jgi:hypothetical protein
LKLRKNLQKLRQVGSPTLAEEPTLEDPLWPVIKGVGLNRSAVFGNTTSGD